MEPDGTGGAFARPADLLDVILTVKVTVVPLD